MNLELKAKLKEIWPEFKKWAEDNAEKGNYSTDWPCGECGGVKDLFDYVEKEIKQ